MIELLNHLLHHPTDSQVILGSHATDLEHSDSTPSTGPFPQDLP